MPESTALAFSFTAALEKLLHSYWAGFLFVFSGVAAGA